MSKYTPPGGGGGLPPRTHRAKPKKKEGCLMAIPQVVVALVRLAFRR